MAEVKRVPARGHGRGLAVVTKGVTTERPEECPTDQRGGEVAGKKPEEQKKPPTYQLGGKDAGKKPEELGIGPIDEHYIFFDFGSLKYSNDDPKYKVGLFILAPTNPQCDYFFFPSTLLEGPSKAPEKEIKVIDDLLDKAVKLQKGKLKEELRGLSDGFKVIRFSPDERVYGNYMKSKGLPEGCVPVYSEVWMKRVLDRLEEYDPLYKDDLNIYDRRAVGHFFIRVKLALEEIILIKSTLEEIGNKKVPERIGEEVERRQAVYEYAERQMMEAYDSMKKEIEKENSRRKPIGDAAGCKLDPDAETFLKQRVLVDGNPLASIDHTFVVDPLHQPKPLDPARKTRQELEEEYCKSFKK